MESPRKRRKAKRRKSTFDRNIRPETIRVDQMRDLRSINAHHEAGHHDFLAYVIACMYGICLGMLGNEPALERLRANPFFRGMAQPPKDDDLTRWVAFYVLKAKRGNKRDRAGRYAAILNRYLREKLPVDLAEQRLKDEGGVAKAYALSTGGSSAPKAQVAPVVGIAKRAALATGAATEIAEDIDEEDEEGEAPAALGRVKSSPEKAQHASKRKATKNDLVVGTSESLMNEACKRPGPLVIYAVATPNPEKDLDWMDIVAARIERRPA